MGLFGPPNVEKMKAKRDVNALIKVLNYQSSWQVRGKAARALGELKDARSVEALIGALKDEESGVCSIATWALGEIGDARALEPLITAIKDNSWEVGKAAVRALMKFGAPAIIDAMKDEDKYVPR